MAFTNYKALFESSTNGRLLIYAQCIIDFNHNAPKLLQISPENLIGQDFAKTLAKTQAYDNFAELNLSKLLAKALTGESQTFNWFYLSTDQQTINIEITITKISIDNKDYAEVRLVDTTQRSQLQQAINFIASESVSDTDNSFFENLLKKLSELFFSDYALIGLVEPETYASIETFTVCAHGKIVNNITYDIKGTPCDEVIGKEPRAYPRDIQKLFPNDHLLTEMKAESFVGIPLFNSKNIPIGLIAILDAKPMKNISHIKEIMQIYALRIANEIERLITNKELKMAKEVAEQAYQAKAEFLSNMSHELRTPLHAILSYSDFGIKRKNLSDEKLLRYFNAIHLSGDRLLHLVNNLLDLSKIEAGKLDLNLTKQSIIHIIKNCIEELNYANETKNINVIFNTKTTHDTLYCDKTLIHQLLINIFSNAIKFSPQDNSIEIRVKNIKSKTLRKESIYITVSDHGIGIPDNELDDIFNEFIQSSATKTGAGGTGLGLAISRNIVKAHHGEIWATNNDNETGALFHIVLPLGITDIDE